MAEIDVFERSLAGAFLRLADDVPGAVDAAAVWPERIVPKASGVSGDPKAASAELGQVGITLIVQRSVAAILALQTLEFVSIETLWDVGEWVAMVREANA